MSCLTCSALLRPLLDFHIQFRTHQLKEKIGKFGDHLEETKVKQIYKYF